MYKPVVTPESQQERVSHERGSRESKTIGGTAGGEVAHIAQLIPLCSCFAVIISKIIIEC